MLFFAYYRGIEKYVVVDTESDLEILYTLEKLMSLRRRRKILGLSTGRIAPVITIPYQPDETVTQLQVKTHLLKHVRVTTYKSKITQVYWNPDEITTPVSIRLSDFGDECTDCILYGIPWSNGVHKVTIVLDDNIKLGNFTFRLARDNRRDVVAERLGVVLDLREMLNDELAGCVYHAIYESGGSADDFKVILDGDNRKNLMRCMYWRG